MEMNPENFERNLRNLERMLRDGRPLPDVQRFKEQRGNTLLTIEEVIDKLNTIAVPTNYAEGAGNVSSIVGSLATLAGAVLAFTGSPNAAKIVDIGSFLNRTGNVVYTIANLTERGLSRLYLNDVVASLTADQRACVELREWLDYSRDLDANIRSLFGCSLESNLLQNVVVIFTECTTLYSLGSTQIQHYRDLLVEKSGKFAKSISDDIDSIMICLNRFVNQAQVSSDVPILMRNSCAFLQVSLGVYEIRKMGMKLFGSKSEPESLAATSVVLQPTQGAVIKCCIFEAVNIATNVLSLLSVKTVISTGESHYSESLKELTFQLKRELTLIERLFP